MSVAPVSGSTALPVNLPSPQKSCIEAPVILRQVISINQSEKQLKDQAIDFINNGNGTYANGGFTRATTASFMETGEWLENPAKRVRENRELKSKEIGLQIKELKKQEQQFTRKFTDNFADAHNLEHVVGQGVMAPRIKDILADKELKAAQTLRSKVVDNAAAYLEDKHAHAQHVGSKRIIPWPAKDTSDAQRFNTIDRDNRIFFNEKGKAFRLIECKADITVEEIKAFEQAKKEYDKIVTGLIKHEHSPSAAVQFNQLEYVFNPTFQKIRNINDATEKATPAAAKNELKNRASDVSYFHMVKEINTIPYTPGNLLSRLQENKEFEITTLEITRTEKIEMVLARLTATRGEYPSAALAKQTVQEIGLEIPDCLSELAQPVTPEDNLVPYYTLFND